MRVVTVETGSPASITPCGTYSWGETEDYLVNIVLGCVAGTFSAQPANTSIICNSNATFSVTANGTAYNTNTSTISITQPTMSINGSSSFCSGSLSYSINYCNKNKLSGKQSSGLVENISSTSAIEFTLYILAPLPPCSGFRICGN